MTKPPTNIVGGRLSQWAAGLPRLQPGMRGVGLHARIGPAGEVPDETERNHEAGHERDDHEKDHQDSCLALRFSFAPEGRAEELADVTERAAQIVHSRNGVVNLSEAVPACRGDACEVAPLIGSMDRVSRDGEAAAEDGEDDRHIPEAEHPLHHLLAFFDGQRRLFTASQEGDGEPAECEQNRHREADAGLDHSRPENGLLESAAERHHILPGRADRVAVPDRNQDIEGENTQKQKHFHSWSPSFQRAEIART